MKASELFFEARIAAMILATKWLLKHARPSAFLALAIWLLIWNLGLISQLSHLGPERIQHALILSCFALILFIIVALNNCFRLRKAFENQERIAQTNAELLEELKSQRDQLAQAIIDQSEGNRRLRLLESAVVHARDAVIVLEAEPSGEMGRSVLYVNEAFTQITGYEQSEVLGRSLHYLRGPRSDGQTLEQLRQALNTNSCLQTEILNYRKDGSEVWVELNLVPVYESPGSEVVAHWVMIQRDATDRKRAEEALRHSEERLRAIYENTSTGVVVLRPTGDILEVNPAFCRMLGRETPELIHRRVQDFTYFGDVHIISELLQDVSTSRRTHYNRQKRYLHKSGQIVWVDLHCHVIYNIAREPVSVIGVVIDITERKRVQEALRRSEERYRWLFDFSPQPMCVVDRMSLKFLAVNEAAIQKYGYNRDEFLTLSLQDVTESQDHHTLRRRLIGDATKTEREIWHHRRKNGEILHVEVTANDLPIGVGNATATLMLLTDVTEKQHLEEQLRQAQKMEGIGQLAGGIAHDFNNLLTGIVGNLALIDLPQHDSNRQLVHTAERAAHRAADLTRKLLGFARRNQLLLTPVRVTDFFNEVIGLLQRTFDPRIEIVVQIYVSEPIMADATLINQALLNLCINSRDAMPQGGRLTLRADVVDVGPELIKLHSEARVGSFVRLTIEDTGVGMPPEVRSRVFEPFFTTKPIGQGTGLGLPMVHGILKQHHGWVTFESTPGQGTRFDLYLPRAPHRLTDDSPIFRRTSTPREVPMDTLTPRPLRRTPALPTKTTQEKPTILLVDDEEMIRDIARLTLESAGYIVKECCDGLDGVEVFRNHHNQIDLVLLDLTMPRLSGRDAFNQMIAINPNARILFASGYSTDDLSDLSGAIGLLPKPYRPQDLLQAVRNILIPNETISATA
jgi:two-component system, cell cycle sensor histidine kinase and response regulator CckA